jgi:hypothetical protein
LNANVWPPLITESFDWIGIIADNIPALCDTLAIGALTTSSEAIKSSDTKPNNDKQNILQNLST